MRKLSLFVITVLIIFSCASTAENKNHNTKKMKYKEKDTATMIVMVILDNINKLPNKKVAVADFTDLNGNESVEGKLLAEQIITKLSQASNVKIIERSQLKKILKEQELGMTGVTEAKETQTGKVMDVDALITGTIIHSKENVEVNARMIDVNTGEIYCAANPKIKTEQRKKEIDMLPEKDKEKVNKEFNEREKWIKDNPELFKVMEKHKHELRELKQRNPRKYHEILNTIQILERFKRERPRLFLLSTEPPNSLRIKRLKRENPRRFEKTQRLRRNLKIIIDHSPSYLEKIKRERRSIIKRIKESRWER